MKYQSEAQAYQAIRRDIKKKRDRAQRHQNEYMWTIENGGERHPNLYKFIKRFNQTSKLPLLPPDVAIKQACKYQSIVAECQMFLNTYRVKQNENADNLKRDN